MSTLRVSVREASGFVAFAIVLLLASCGGGGGSDGGSSSSGTSTFNVSGSTSTGSHSMTVTFDAPPNTAQATTLTNYSVPNLTLSGTPTLSGNTVTLITSMQSATTYTMTVTGVTRASNLEPLTTKTTTFTGRPIFNVVSAASTGNTTMTVTFDALPEVASATTLGNYDVPGLTFSGTPILNGGTVTLTTSSQQAISYTVTVAGVTRAGDGEALTTHTTGFTGRTGFNVASAASTSNTKMTVTFDAPPNAAQATTLANYSVPGLTLSGTPTLSGSAVTLTTSSQLAISYTITVSSVTRAGDGEPLTVAAADLNGHASFNVASAASTSSAKMTVTFDAPPETASAINPANYSVPGLTLSGTPTLNGNTVALTTSIQSATTFTVSVTGVTRASDGEPLANSSAMFTGMPVAAPTVANVVALSTNPDNSTIPYNTGTTTVRITGTDFISVTCPSGVQLDDLNGAGIVVATQPTSCTVDSDTQITATFPSGIRTNGTTGWNVKVTNGAGTNATSSVKLLPRAGLLISEIFTGTLAGTDHEFVELYNPTASALDIGAAGLGLHLHIRDATGATDTDKALTQVTTGTIAPHGFLLIASSASMVGDPWFTHRDFTYSALTQALVVNGGVYISLSATNHAKVIDKVGWGTQPAPGFEGAAPPDIPSGFSAERKPAGGLGHATDTDSNMADFNAPSSTLTPRGTADLAQP